jgi:hypothetical protein
MVDHLSPMKRVEALASYQDALESGARPGETDHD